MSQILIPMLNFFLKNLVVIHKGSIASKIKSTFLISFSLSPFPFLVEKLTNWYMANYGYVAFVLIAILFDHFLGSWVHAFIKRDFEMKKNIQGLFIKCAMVLVVGILGEGFQHILGTANFLTDYFNLMTRLMVFVYPAGSSLMNCAIITNGRFPPTSWISKITHFNSDMDLNYFKTNQKTEPHEKETID